MTARHSGETRIADQALLDQVKAAVDDMKVFLSSPLADDPNYQRWVNRWAGRALALLEQIGELSQ